MLSPTGPRAHYQWRVRAIDAERRTSPLSDTATFELYRTPPGQAPEPIGEEIQVDAP